MSKPWSPYDARLATGYRVWSRAAQERWDRFWLDAEHVLRLLLDFLRGWTNYAVMLHNYCEHCGPYCPYIVRYRKEQLARA